MNSNKIPIGLVDDHQLVLKSLGMMVSCFDDFEVAVEATSGAELQSRLATASALPEIMLIDVNMPVMDGYDVAKWLSENHPAIRLVALSMNDEEKVMIGMMKAGCCAYLSKSLSPNELEKALTAVHKKGYYNPDINPRTIYKKEIELSEREKEFLQEACSDSTYQQIAAHMHLSESRVDDIRKSLFEKLQVKSRVGLALEAVKRSLVKL